MIDPYRTLGLEPGAAMADVKRAYRRLAKAYHPDSAGEAALPRFLAINEAYEAIRAGRPIAPGRRSAGASSDRPPAEAWRADPDRARAAREQARRRAGAAGTTGAAGGAGAPGRAGSTPPGGAGASGGSRGRSGAGGSTGGAGGSTGTSGEARAGASRRTSSGGSRGRRHVRKATMGSTSYDEARDHQDANDPTWSGASWYGPSTGEYWIINPREYADPRKHGPEYQSRARRMAEAAPLGRSGPETDAEEEIVDADAADLGDGASPAAAQASGQARADGQARAAHRGAGRREPSRADTPTARGDAARSFGAATAGAERGTRREARGSASARPRREAWAGTTRGGTVREGARQPDAAAAAWSSAWPPRARSARRAGTRRRSLPRDLIGGPADDPIRRLGIALIAWPPIGIAAAALIGDVTGCATFSASCGGTEPMLPWLAQAAIIGLLLLLPPIARILAGGSIGVLVALVPLTAFLVAVGGTGAPQAGFALAFLLGLAWLLGIAWGVAQLRRRGLARVGS